MHRFNGSQLLLVLLALIAAMTILTHRLPEGGRDATGEQGMVVSVSRPATLVGLGILRQGGNAVDAAVATAFALAVTFPEAGNIGGGGFMMVAPPDSEPVCIEYRETAPAAATPTMYAPEETQLGHRAVGVPGTVRGLALAHARFGSLPWRTLVEPAVLLAREGFVVDGRLARSLNRLLDTAGEFRELVRVFGKPGGRRWRAGDRLVQPDLARTLTLIAAEGPDAFYRGAIAQQIVAEMQAGGGLVALADLAAYDAQERTPIHGTFRGYDVYGPPPPSSGGIVLVEMLNILSACEVDWRNRWSPDVVHAIIEAMRRAYCDRARYLGDPDFVSIPDQLVSSDYARRLAAGIDRARATPSESLAPEIALAPDSPSTTHFSIIDDDGLAVSNTYTLEQSYGSRVVVRGAGFLLNNEMGDFNTRPGVTDRQGGIGTEPNLIAPGKRMLSAQTPVIVMKDRQPVLVTGSPGGRTIPNTVLQVVLGMLACEQDLRAASDDPRLHHQWFPDRVKFEGARQRRFAPLVAALRARGHDVVDDDDRQGDAHSIFVRDGVYYGVADRRISGFAAGW